ncbi:MAG: hypothetical protein N2037_13395 [Acidimicrobiales bacterium]|nr:hypothetical protein [Acidimicrobiales bacterium]
MVLASEGYPTSPRTGDRITGLDEAAALEGVDIYCAGVGRDEEGRLVTAGGRVLGVVGHGHDLSRARTRAYEAASRISWPGMHYRRDIARGAAAVCL